jgi:transcriptional regulator with XRE-family HTH domain
MNMAQKLVQSRLENNLTQKQLGANTNISISVIGNIETSARKPSKTVAYKLAKFFNTEISYWYEEKDALNYVIDRNDLDNTEQMIKELTEKGYIKDGIVNIEAWEFIKEAITIDLQLSAVKRRIK